MSSSSSQPQCHGSPTFNEALSQSAFSEWPDNLPGLICKTPPMGYYSAQRFAQCCSGKIYNITEPTKPGDAAYPVSCALLCQVDPKLNENDKQYPYGFSEHFMCLNNGYHDSSDTDDTGGSLGSMDGGEVVCATVTAKNGESAPTSYPHSWTGYWQTRTWERNGIDWTWVHDGDSAKTATATSASETPETSLETTSTSSSSSEKASETSESSKAGEEKPASTSKSSEGGSSSATAPTSSPTDGAHALSGLSLKGLLVIAACVAALAMQCE